MNRKTLIEAVHVSHQDLSKAHVSRIVDSVLSSMKTAIINGEDILLQKFISLKHITKKARNGLNPYHGVKIQIPAKKTLKLKISSILKKELNK
jgi:nucleoid DNA-binding protein